MPLCRSWINPLKCTELDLPDGSATTGNARIPDAEELLRYLCAPEVDCSREAFVARYREITTIPDSLHIVPAEPTILGKLVWPLKHAKGSYALGNYVGCIALCGMVGEMVAILIWDISKVSLQGHTMTNTEQRAMFGDVFEKLGQERRVNVLRTLNLIDDSAKAGFDNLRAVRRKYLHFLSQTHSQVASDARSAYGDALKVVAVVLGHSFKDGAVVLRKDLMAYLAEKGIALSEEQGDGKE